MLSNNPPVDANPLRERLAEQHAVLAQRAAELVSAAARVPLVLDDETAPRAADFVKQIKMTIKQADETRKEEKAPYLEGGRTVDSYFGEIVDSLKTAAETVEGRIGEYFGDERSRTRGDFGALATTRVGWEFDIHSPDEIELEKLRPYLTRPAIEQAIRAYIRAGGRRLAGVHIYEARKALVR